MNRILPGLLSFLVLFMVVSSITAHDLWLVPQKFMVDPGGLLIVSANTGMDFPKSLSAVDPDRVDRFIIVGKSTEEHVTDSGVKGDSLVAEYRFKKPGTYIIGMALKPKEIRLTGREFNEYLLHDGLPNIYELRKKEGILDKPAVEHYSKYPKTVVQVGNKLTSTPLEPLGLPIEIVPKTNPYQLKAGDELTVVVIFKGKPLHQAEIAWSYPGKGEEFAGSKKTDAVGSASIPLVKKGPYVIRLTHMEWVKEESHEWESYWASLTFEVLSP
jgi:uncharacterized GH25 family protein